MYSRFGVGTSRPMPRWSPYRNGRRRRPSLQSRPRTCAGSRRSAGEPRREASRVARCVCIGMALIYTFGRQAEPTRRRRDREVHDLAVRPSAGAPPGPAATAPPDSLRSSLAASADPDGGAIMNDTESARRRALARLDALAGDWTEQVDLPGVPAGRMSFQWTLDRQFLVQRSEIPNPDFPDSVAIIALAADGTGCTQHYFDS